MEDAFDAWAQQEKIVPVSDYEIVGPKSESEEPHMQGAGVVIVHTLINGDPHTLRVPPTQRLTWLHETP